MSTLLLATLPACARPAPPTETIELRYGTDESPIHERYRYLIIPFHREIEERTNHRVRITSFPAESLVTAEQVYDSIMTGVIDMGDCNTMDNPGRFTLHEAVLIPGLGATSPEIASRTVWELNKEFRQAHAEFDGIKLFWLVVKPATHIFSNKPIRNMEDLKGMKIRSYSVNIEAMELLGGTPVSMKFSDVYELMGKGGIDGFMTNMTAIVPRRLYEVCKYATLVPLGGGIVNWGGMSLDRFNELPEDIQDVFDDVTGDKLADKFATFHEEWDNHYADKVATKYGLQEIILEPAEWARWQGRIAPVTDKWAAEIDAKGLPGTDVVKFIRERFDHYGGK